MLARITEQPMHINLFSGFPSWQALPEYFPSNPVSIKSLS